MARRSFAQVVCTLSLSPSLTLVLPRQHVFYGWRGNSILNCSKWNAFLGGGNEMRRCAMSTWGCVSVCVCRCSAQSHNFHNINIVNLHKCDRCTSVRAFAALNLNTQTDSYAHTCIHRV